MNFWRQKQCGKFECDIHSCLDVLKEALRILQIRPLNLSFASYCSSLKLFYTFKFLGEVISNYILSTLLILSCNVMSCSELQ